MYAMELLKGSRKKQLQTNAVDELGILCAWHNKVQAVPQGLNHTD